MTLKDRLVRRIRERGPLPFSTFMDVALYDPDLGYYAAGAVRTGWMGDFVTSPQLDPAFGALWAGAVEGLWRDMGEPDSLEVVEVGPGEGAFAAALLDALPEPLRAAVSYRLVERIPQVRARQRELLDERPRVTWSASVDELPEAAARMVIANELLDNMPVDLVEVHAGALRAVLVGERKGELVEVPGGPVPPPENLDLGALREGHRFEIRPALGSLIGDLANRMERGIVVFIDYGYERGEVPRRPRGTLVCYSSIGPDEEPLVAPGTKDITAHVDWSAVAAEFRSHGLQVAGPHPQRDVLRALGAGGLDRRMQRDHAAALAEGRGADAVALLSRRHALRALLDPGGLGRLDVMLGYKGTAAPSFLGEMDGRIAEPAP